MRALAPSRPFAPRAGTLPATSADALPWLRVHVGSACACIDVEGVPNLLHELVHVVLAGCLADDHGFDYQAIPYDLARPDGRAVLWNELSACVVSCAYLLPRAPDAASWSRVDAWFDEQLGIQPIFYGRDHGRDDDGPRFFADVAELAQHHAAELAAMTRCAYGRVATLLRWAGAPPELVSVGRELHFAELWARRTDARGAAA